MTKSIVKLNLNYIVFFSFNSTSEIVLIVESTTVLNLQFEGLTEKNTRLKENESIFLSKNNILSSFDQCKMFLFNISKKKVSRCVRKGKHFLQTVTLSLQYIKKAYIF